MQRVFIFWNKPPLSDSPGSRQKGSFRLHSNFRRPANKTVSVHAILQFACASERLGAAGRRRHEETKEQANLLTWRGGGWTLRTPKTVPSPKCQRAYPAACCSLLQLAAGLRECWQAYLAACCKSACQILKNNIFHFLFIRREPATFWIF